MRVQGFIERQQQSERAAWERARIIAWSSFAPHIDSKKTPDFNPKNIFLFADEQPIKTDFSDPKFKARIAEMRGKKD